MQRPQSVSTSAPAKNTSSDVPAELTWVLVGLGVLVLFHLGSVVLLLVQRDSVVAQFFARNPLLSASQVGVDAGSTIIGAVVIHLVFAALYAWLGLNLRGAKNWARLGLTIVLIAATLIHYFFYAAFPLFRFAIPIANMLQLILLGLLWIPAGVRAYFTGTYAAQHS